MCCYGKNKRQGLVKLKHSTLLSRKHTLLTHLFPLIYHLKFTVAELLPFLVYLIKFVTRYGKIFQYLLRLKRTQMELEKSWASVMHQDHTDFAKRRNDRLNCSISQQRRQRFRPMWRVREHMAFLIRNLQFYIQVSSPRILFSQVIIYQFAELKSVCNTLS